MLKLARSFFFSLLLSGINILVVSAQDIDITKLDRYFQSLESGNKFMGSVSVFRDGVEIYTKSVGFADVDKRIRADQRTIYAIGSISKTFTAVMVFQSIEKGRLSLTETLDTYFPSIKNSEKITLAHLLGHRSGIRNFTVDEKFPTWQTQHKSKEQMVEIIAQGGVDFEPGSKFQYSNSNYVLLSFILESIYQKPFKDILADQITKPLSLDHTLMDGNTAKSNGSHSYKYFDRWRIEQKTSSSITLGAGGIISTPKDINVFFDALFNGRIISANNVLAMRTIKDGYGMGLIPVPFYSKRGYGHSGGVDGFHSMAIYFPEDKIAYAITSNGLNCVFNDLHIATLSCIYGMSVDLPNVQDVNLDPNVLDTYTGVYSCSQLPIKLTVTVNNGQIMCQGTGQSAFPLEPTSENRFKFSPGGIVVEFNPNENTLILKQGGGVFYFKKE